MRIQDKAYHHGRRAMIDSLIKSNNVDELVDKDIKYTMNQCILIKI